MNSFVPTSNPSFTSQECWQTEPETSTKVPKSLADQVSKTAKGRVMQVIAGERRDDVAALVQDGYDRVDFNGKDRDAIATFIEEDKLSIRTEGDGSFSVSDELDTAELRAMKETFLDLRLDTDPEKRQEMLEGINKLVAKVDEAIASQENLEAPQGIVSALIELKELHGHVRSAIQSKNFSDLPYLNEKLIRAALKLLDAFEKVRASDPDKMIKLVEELRSSDGPMNPYKTALINFVGTHNSFGFSEEIQDGLEYAAKRDSIHEQKRGGRPSFTQALLSAHSAPKSKDDPYTFLQQTTRIPENRFRQIVTSALRSN